MLMIGMILTIVFSETSFMGFQLAYFTLCGFESCTLWITDYGILQDGGGASSIWLKCALMFNIAALTVVAYGNFKDNKEQKKI